MRDGDARPASVRRLSVHCSQELYGLGIGAMVLLEYEGKHQLVSTDNYQG